MHTFVGTYYGINGTSNDTKGTAYAVYLVNYSNLEWAWFTTVGVDAFGLLFKQLRKFQHAGFTAGWATIRFG
jgi:hypothetical protein